MKTIALVCQKGGVGKTTLAVNLAVCAHLSRKRVALIDIDPQASAADWNAERHADKRLDVVRTDISQLQAALAAAKARAVDIALIDTPGRIETTAAAAARLADFVLIPTRPVFFDLKASAATIQIAQTSGTPFSILFNLAPRGHITVEESRAVLEGCNIPVLADVIHHYAAFYHAAQGSSVFEYDPDGPAAEEIKTLFNTLKKVINA